MKEKYVVLGGAAIALLALLFPPWHTDLGGRGFRGDVSLLSGWSFIGGPPNPLAKIDLGILVVELAAIALVISVIIYLLRAKH